ncbi:LRV domain-containing protein [Nocardia jejuensis]|uniref:LRV domain-containing protein n=1 Tax=Nocardia jejuensis TaxID=328049 RepID=UPI0012FC2FE1|nr:LRV domain-containing protein [Nocardia jejuensis]
MKANVKAIARNPSAPAKVLLRILDSGWSGAAAVISRPHLPDTVYDAAIAHRDQDVRTMLASSETAPAAQRARLAADPSTAVRLHVAAGPIPDHTPVEPLPDKTYARLITDRSPAVRAAACLNWPDPPVATLDRLLNDPDLETRTVAAARSWRRLPHLLSLIATAGHAALHLWSEPIATAPLTTDALTTLLSHDEWIRRLLAENPYLPADIIARLAADQNPDVRLAVSMRREFSENTTPELDMLIGRGDEITPAFWPRTTTDPALMRHAVESTHLGLRRSVAYNPRLSRTLLAQLAAADDPETRLILCETHPHAPADLLWDVLRESPTSTRRELIAHPNFPTHRLRTLFHSADGFERSLIVYDTAASAELIEQLSYDADPRVRRAAAGDPRLSMLRLFELIDDPSISNGAAANPNLPVPIMELFLARAGIR